MPSRDLARSRAVLIGTWDYEHLENVPAARNSLVRMHSLLTGPLCGWPADQVTVIDNRVSPGDLHDELIELYSETEPGGMALFYYVGHGQADDQDRLCLGLAGSRTDYNRRASTSMRFDDVREALRLCDAATKIVMLDCCFSGLAARQNLSGADVLDLARAPGAYTMAASGAYRPAWYETDADEPQTYFTKYFADVVESGIVGEAAGLMLDRIFAETLTNLSRDGKPEPTHTARHQAGQTVFARNAAPVEEQVDLQSRIAELEELLRARNAELPEKAAETDEIIETSEAEARHAAAVKELDVARTTYKANVSVPSDDTPPTSAETSSHRLAEDLGQLLRGHAGLSLDDVERAGQTLLEQLHERFQNTNVRKQLPHGATMTVDWFHASDCNYGNRPYRLINWRRQGLKLIVTIGEPVSARAECTPIPGISRSRGAEHGLIAIDANRPTAPPLLLTIGDIHPHVSPSATHNIETWVEQCLTALLTEFSQALTGALNRLGYDS